MNRDIFKTEFNKQLQTYLTQQIQTVQPYCFSNELSNIYNFLLPYSEGGKRIRPYLIYLFYKIGGGTDDQTAYNAGVVSELIHLFALIHDDINDKGTIRHNLPTFHMYAAEQLHDTYQGINMGILIGDILQSWAYQLLHSLSLPSTTKSFYFEMLNTTMYGQIQDVYLSHTATMYTKDIITAKDNAKSGHYSIMRPMIIGYSINQHQEKEFIQQLGERLGLAFQMRDDLLDIIDGHGNKTSFSDHQEGNQTFLLAHALECATPVQKDYLLQTRGTICDTDTKNNLLDIYSTTGTIVRAKKEINNELDICITEFRKRVATTPHLKTTYAPYVEDIIAFLAIK